MASTLSRVVLFLSSYSPLFLIVGLLNSSDAWVTLVFFGIAFGSIIVLFLFLRTYREITPYSVTLKSVSSRDSDAMSYIVTYLLPFLGISFKEVLSAVSFVIFIVVIGIIYVSSNMVYINPILSFRGYHLFEVEDEAGKVSALICKRPYVSAGSTINVVSLGDFAIMEKRVRK